MGASIYLLIYISATDTSQTGNLILFLIMLQEQWKQAEEMNEGINLFNSTKYWFDEKEERMK